jgi:hypothetical protein
MITSSSNYLASVRSYSLYFLAYLDRGLRSSNKLLDHFGIVGSGLLDDIDCEGRYLFVEYVFLFSYEFENVEKLLLGKDL